MSIGKNEPGLIFDFDGVLALSEGAHMASWDDTALELGRALPAGFAERGIGVPDGAMAAELRAHWDCGEDEAALLLLKRRHYRRRAPEETRPVPGAFEALAAWAARHPVGLATSSRLEDVEPVLQQAGATGLFASILTIEQVARPKPDPEIYLRSAERLGLAPGACWVFEDSRPGIAAARAAGCRVIGMATSHNRAALAGAEVCFPDFREWRLIERYFLKSGARAGGAGGLGRQI